MFVAHNENMAFFKEIFTAFSQYIESNEFLGIVDLGSLDINGGPQVLVGKDIRYVGIDLGDGPNVDLVRPIELIDLPSLSFSMTISSEMLEHNPFWREALFQMVRLTSLGGLVVWTCAGIGRPEHGTTRSDGGHAAPLVTGMGREYYKNISAEEAANAFDHELWYECWNYFENFQAKDTYFIGLRKGSSQENRRTFSEINEKFSKMYVSRPTLRSFFHKYHFNNMVEMCLRAARWRRYVRVYSPLVLKFYQRNKFKKMKSRLKYFLNSVRAQ